MNNYCFAGSIVFLSLFNGWANKQFPHPWHSKRSVMLMYSIANIHGLGVRLSCFLFLSVYFNTLLITEDEEG